MINVPVPDLSRGELEDPCNEEQVCKSVWHPEGKAADTQMKLLSTDPVKEKINIIEVFTSMQKAREIQNEASSYLPSQHEPMDSILQVLEASIV